MLLDRLFSTRQACFKLATLRGLLDSNQSFLLTTSLIINLGFERIKRRAFLSVNRSRECEKMKPFLQELSGAKRKRTKHGGARHGCLVFCLLFCLLMHDTSLRSSSLNLLFTSNKNVYVSVQ